MRWYSSSALREIGEAAVEALSQALQDADWETRYGAARALDGIMSTRAAERLDTLLLSKLPKSGGPSELSRPYRSRTCDTLILSFLQ